MIVLEIVAVLVAAVLVAHAGYAVGRSVGETELKDAEAAHLTELKDAEAAHLTELKDAVSSSYLAGRRAGFASALPVARALTGEGRCDAVGMRELAAASADEHYVGQIHAARYRQQ